MQTIWQGVGHKRSAVPAPCWHTDAAVVEAIGSGVEQKRGKRRKSFEPDETNHRMDRSIPEQWRSASACRKMLASTGGTIVLLVEKKNGRASLIKMGAHCDVPFARLWLNGDVGSDAQQRSFK